MRAPLLALCCLAAAARAAAQAQGSKVTRALAPFSALDLGGCLPFGLRVAEGADYAIEIVAEDGVAAHVASKVSSSGALSVYASDSFRTSSPLGVTVFMPAGALSSLSLSASAPVLVTVPPAANLDVKASGNGWVHVNSAPVAAGGAVTVSLSGTADVLLCAPAPTSVASLDARLSGTASLLVDNYVADSLSAALSGLGDLTLQGAPATSARLELSGSGKLSAAARRADVTLRGMGDVFVSGADALTGQISGMGNVHYSPPSATCSLSGFGMGSCSPGEAPTPRLSCGDHDGKELDAANARGFDVQVSGSQCQVRTPLQAGDEEVTETRAPSVSVRVERLWARLRG